MYGADKGSMMHEDKPGMMRYFYRVADPNVPEGKRWSDRFSRNAFIAVGGVVALSLILCWVIR